MQIISKDELTLFILNQNSDVISKEDLKKFMSMTSHKVDLLSYKGTVLDKQKGTIKGNLSLMEVYSRVRGMEDIIEQLQAIDTTNQRKKGYSVVQ